MGFFSHVPCGVFQGRRPRAVPTKLATPIGALSSKRVHWSVPRSVTIDATNVLPGGRPFVASASVHLPWSGSSAGGGDAAGGGMGRGGASMGRRGGGAARTNGSVGPEGPVGPAGPE